MASTLFAIDWTLISPELLLAGGALVLVLLTALYRPAPNGFAVEDGIPGAKGVARVALLILLATGALLVTRFGAAPGVTFSGMFLSNEFIVAMKILIILAAALALVLVLGAGQVYMPLQGEFSILLLFSVLGMFVMVSANDFLSLYMGLELQSLCLYVLAAMHRDDVKSSEAGLKYFVLGAVASGLLLYGISLIYGFTGTTRFADIVMLYQSQVAPLSLPLGVVVGLVLVLIGLCFKISAVPFHMWTPDVYEGAPTTVTAFFAMAPKVAAMALFIRVVYEPFGQLVGQWQQIVVVVAALSMIIGALGALRQQHIKRLLAYSSIGHVGYMLVGVASGTVEGVKAVVIYLGLYVIMTAGTFACVMMMRRRQEFSGEALPNERLEDLAGLSKNHPVMAANLAILMLSMAGIPPLAGFFGKFYVFLAAVEAGLYWLAVVGVLSSVIAAYYYLKIIKLMYFDAPVEALDRNVSPGLRVVAALSALVNVLFILAPQALVALATVATGVFI